MKNFVLLLATVLAGAQAIQPGNGKMRNKSLVELKETLEKIRSNLLSMKPTIDVAAGLIDTYTAPQADSMHTVNQALAQLNEKNLPGHCLQEATAKLNQIKKAVDQNCTAVNVVEDVGSITYNTIDFVAVAMVTLDEVLNGLNQCGPWYEFWHYIPCVISYAWSSYKDLSQIVTAAVHTWKENEASVEDITAQVACHLHPFHQTANEVLNEAYLCSKNSF